MSGLRSRPWFFPSLAVFLYLTGMNDEALHRLGQWWLGFGRWGQTAAVLVLLALLAYFTQDVLNRRRSAYRAAVRAADATRPPAIQPGAPGGSAPEPAPVSRTQKIEQRGMPGGSGPEPAQVSRSQKIEQRGMPGGSGPVSHS